MTNYNCCRCGYETILKSDFRRHLMRKNICKNKMKKISDMEFYKYYQDEFPEVVSKITSYHTNPHNLHNMPHKTTQNICCKYCDKMFSRNDSMKRHVDKYCKIKIELDKDKQIIELKKEIKELKKSNKNNGSTVINNINNGTINNINVVQLGSENADEALTKLEKQSIFKCGIYTMVPKLIEKVHCNKRLPQFQNVTNVNLQSKYCEKYDEKTKKFIKVLKKEFMEIFLDYKRYELEEICNNPENKASEKTKSYVDKICERIDNKEDHKKYIDEMIDTIFLLLYNYHK